MYLKFLFRESHNSFPSDDAVSRTKLRPAPESLSPFLYPSWSMPNNGRVCLCYASTPHRQPIY